MRKTSRHGERPSRTWFLSVLFLLTLSHTPAAAQTSSFQGDSIDILHYNLDITLTRLREGVLRGGADIQVHTLLDSVRTVGLMLAPSLRIDTVWIDEEPAFFRRKGKRVVLFLPEEEEKGSTVLVTLRYHGKPARDPFWGGFYFVRDRAFNMGVGMNVVPHPFGRAWYPCRDNFTDKATYDYFITVPDTMTAACPGMLEQVINNRDGTRTFHWNLSDPIPTYLSAVSVSNYHILQDTLHSERGSLPALYFVPPDRTTDAVTTFSHVQDYLTVFERLFGPYRWEKIGYATVPFPHGAMEHATCIFIPEPTVDGTKDHEGLLVHEFSHSWFGNLVTCEKAEDMWLNEGWATYCEALYLEQTSGRKRYDDHMRTLHRKVLQFAHVRDRGYFALAGIPSSVTYGMTVYQKGADIIHTLRNFLGDELFFAALKKYFHEYAFGNISTEGFEAFLSGTTHQHLQDFFNSWIYSPGFPHFRLDSTVVIRDGEDYITGLFIRQDMKGSDLPANHVRIRVTMLAPDWNEENYYITVSGEHQRRTLITSYRPLLVMLNTDQFVSDATTAQRLVVRGRCDTLLSDCFFRLQADLSGDSAYLRVIHHWIGPDTSDLDRRFRAAGERYWSIEGVSLKRSVMRGDFHYDFTHSLRTGYLDTSAPPADPHQLRLLYREGAGKPWTPVEAAVRGTTLQGVLRTQTIRSGDYCIVLSRRQ